MTTITGTNGDDTVTSTSGDDRINTGSGADAIIYQVETNADSTDSYNAGSGADTLIIRMTLATWETSSSWMLIAFEALRNHLATHSTAEPFYFSNYAPAGSNLFDLRIHNIELVRIQVGNGTEVTLSQFLDNLVPDAVNDDVTIAANETGSTGNVITNDSDPDGLQSNLRVVAVNGLSDNVGTVIHGLHGDLTLHADGSYTYTVTDSDNDNSLIDTFAYKIFDGINGTDTATLTITIEADEENAPPVANPDMASTDEDTALVIPFADLLANDTDPDNAPSDLTIMAISNILNGTAILDMDAKTIIFTPALNYEGPSASFEYTLSDGHGGTATGTVNININPINDAPTVSDITADVLEDGGVLISPFAGEDVDSDDNQNTLHYTILGELPAGVSMEAPNAPFFTFNPASLAYQDLSENALREVSFQYTATDSHGAESGLATVTITVHGANDPPVANPDTANTNEDTALIIPFADLLANDEDIDSDDVLTIDGVGTAEHGNVSLNALAQTVTFIPEPNYYGPASFVYVISDNHFGGSSFATVNITIDAVNDIPTVTDITTNILEDGAILTSLFAGEDVDNDDDQSTLNYTILGTMPAGVSLSADLKSFNFDPSDAAYQNLAQGEPRDVVFQYIATDSHGAESLPATVTITVTGINDAPIANTDMMGTDEDMELVIPFADLLANDTDVDTPHSNLTITNVGMDPGNLINGNVILNADNTITFLPTHNYYGPVSFDYTVSDGIGGLSTATVAVTVNSVNDAPTAHPDQLSTDEDVALIIPFADLLANDEDIDNPNDLTIVAVQNARFGSVALDMDAKTITFTPTPNFNSPDSFQHASFDYVLSDGMDGFSLATVDIIVNSINDTPVANPDTASTDEDMALVIPFADLLANDVDIDNPNDLTISTVTNAFNGTVSLDPDTMMITFTPDPDYNGPASFEYTISDGMAESTASVDITVNAVNDAPIARNDSGFTTLEDNALVVPGLLPPGSSGGGGTIGGGGISPLPGPVPGPGPQPVPVPTAGPILRNDSDPDFDPLTAILVSGPLHGSLSYEAGGLMLPGLGPDGAFTYTPDPNFFGTDSFTYKVTDGQLESNIATVTLTVSAVNDAPVANDDSAATLANQMLIVGSTNNEESRLLLNDTDVEGDRLFVSGVLIDQILHPIDTPITLPSGALVTVHGEGSYEYDPNHQFDNVLIGDTALDTFTYVVTDTHPNGTAEGLVSITIQGTKPLAIVGTDQSDFLLGTADNDTIIGKAGNDTLLGLEGDDILQGDQGNDILLGGTGTNTAVYGHNIWNYNIAPTFGTLGNGYSVSYLGLDSMNGEGTDSLNDITQLSFGATEYSSIITPQFDMQPTQDNQIVVGNGQITTYPFSGVALFGGEGPDQLVAISGTVDAILVGGRGDDSLTAGNGSQNIVLVGGLGNDQLFNPAPGNDIAAAYWHEVEDFGFSLQGFQFSSLQLQYLGGEDLRNEGTDLLSGMDHLIFNDMRYELNLFSSTATNDNQIVFYPGGTVPFNPFGPPSFGPGSLNAGNYSNVVLVGGDTVENLIAGPNGSTLMGQGGDDILQGSDGSDVLIGGAGNDILLGGSGADQFVYRLSGDRDGVSVDLIYDFQSGVDKLVFMSPYLTNISMVGRENNLLSDVSGPPPIDGTGSVFIQDTVNHALYYDTNGAIPGGLIKVLEFETDFFGNITTIDQNDLVVIRNPNVTDPPIAVNDTAIIDEDGAANGTGFVNIPVLANDINSNPTGSLFISDFTPSLMGTVQLVYDMDGIARNIQYSPIFFGISRFDYLAVGETATDTFTYTLKDGISEEGSVGIVEVTITGVNDTPMVFNTFYPNIFLKSLPEAQDSVDLTSTILVGTHDPDLSDVLKVTELLVNPSDPIAARLTLANDGHVIYNPGTDFTFLPAGGFAFESFSYRVSDPAGASGVASINLTVVGANDAPVANDLGRAVSEQNTLLLPLSVLGFDYDFGTTLMFNSFGLQGTLGAVTVTSDLFNINLYVQYDPRDAFNYLSEGAIAHDSFTFTLIDNQGAISEEKTVMIDITGINDSPIARDDPDPANLDPAYRAQFVTDENVGATMEGLAIPKAVLLANDSDPEGAALLISSFMGATSLKGAQLRLSNDGLNVIYDPRDALGNNLFDALSQYNPSVPASFTTDSFLYTVFDVDGGGSQASVSLSILGVNDAPIAKSLDLTINEDTVKTLSLSGPDFLGTDPDVGAQLTFDSLTPGIGTVSLTPDNKIVYDPRTAFNHLRPGEQATDSYQFTVKDELGAISNIGTIHFTITGVNDAPIARDDPDPANLDPAYRAQFVTDEDIGAAIGAWMIPIATLLANDSDAEGAVAFDSFVGATSLKGAQLRLSADGLSVIYDPRDALGNNLFDALSQYDPSIPASFTTDSFIYKIHDADGGTAQASVSLTIKGMNDAPIAKTISASIDEDHTLSFTTGMLGSDVDAGASLLFNSASGNAQIINGNQNILYDPRVAFNALALNETDTDTFNFSVIDEKGAISSSGTVTVTLTGRNDPPVAENDGLLGDGSVSPSYTTNEDAAIGLAILANDHDVDHNATLSVNSIDLTNGTPSLLDDTKGSVVANADGTVTYTPGTAFQYLRLNESALDQFRYTAKDNNGGISNTALVTVKVLGADDVPVASDDQAVIDKNDGINNQGITLLSSYLLANDTDLDHDAHLSIVGIDTTNGTTDPSDDTKGLVIFNPDGSITYHTNHAFDSIVTLNNPSAIDVFRYIIQDDDDVNPVTSIAEVSVTVLYENSNPTANPDSATVDSLGGPTNGIDINVIANDTDIDFTAIGLNPTPFLYVSSIDTTGTLGQVSLNANGTIHYDPDGINPFAFRHVETDVFHYTVNDGLGGTAVGTVSVLIAPILHFGMDQYDESLVLYAKDLLPVQYQQELLGFQAYSYIINQGNLIVLPFSFIPLGANYKFVLDTPNSISELPAGTFSAETFFPSFSYNYPQNDDGSTANDVVGTDSFHYSLVQLSNNQVVYQNTITIQVDAVTPTHLGTTVANTLTGGTGNDVMVGLAGNDNISGGNGSDEIYGGSGADALQGGSGNDRIAGGEGDDSIIGGPGSDILFAGSRLGPGDNDNVFNDKFFYSSGDIATGEVDTLMDFDAGDSLFVTNMITAASLNGRSVGDFNNFADRFSIIQGTPSDFPDSTGVNGTVFIYDALHRDLYFDTNGDLAGGAVKFIHFDNHPTMHAVDIVI